MSRDTWTQKMYFCKIQTKHIWVTLPMYQGGGKSLVTGQKHRWCRVAPSTMSSTIGGGCQTFDVMKACSKGCMRADTAKAKEHFAALCQGTSLTSARFSWLEAASIVRAGSKSLRKKCPNLRSLTRGWPWLMPIPINLRRTIHEITHSRKLCSFPCIMRECFDRNGHLWKCTSPGQG